MRQSVQCGFLGKESSFTSRMQAAPLLLIIRYTAYTTYGYNVKLVCVCVCSVVVLELVRYDTCEIMVAFDKTLC